MAKTIRWEAAGGIYPSRSWEALLLLQADPHPISKQPNLQGRMLGAGFAKMAKPGAHKEEGFAVIQG